MKIIRLYRSCTERDERNNYCLTSKRSDPLTNNETLGEIISHVLKSSRQRGVFFSFSPDIERVKKYHNRKQRKTKIAYIDLDLSNMPSGIKCLHPIFLREYLMCLIANSPEILKSETIVDPATHCRHTIVGVLNYSQRTVAGWAYCMREVVIQCDHLQLNIYDEKEDFSQDKNVDDALKNYCIRKPDLKNIKKLRQIIEKTFSCTKLKRKCILDKANSSDWYAS